MPRKTRNVSCNKESASSDEQGKIGQDDGVAERKRVKFVVPGDIQVSDLEHCPRVVLRLSSAKRRATGEKGNECAKRRVGPERKAKRLALEKIHAYVRLAKKCSDGSGNHNE